MQISRAGATVFALLAFAWAVTVKSAIDPDLFWHLGVGGSVLDGGGIPTVERWSWIAEGRTFYPHSWLFDVLLTLLYRAGGFAAIGLLGALMGAFAVTLIYRLSRRWWPDGPSWASAGVTLGAALLAISVWSPRAQVLDLIFTLLALLLLERSRADRRALLLLAPLACLWANLHGAGILAGAVAGAAFLVERLLRGERDALPALLGSGLLAAGAALLSPMGLTILTYPLETLASPVQQALISEWQPLRIDGVGGILIGFLLASTWLGRYARGARPLAVILGLFWAWQALGSVRYTLFGGPFLALWLLPGALVAILPLIERLRSAVGAHGFPHLRARVPLMIGILGAATIVAPRFLPAAYERTLAEQYPVAAADYLVEHDCRGPIANNYGWGGYLIWRWGEPVGHYGAADAFGDELLRPYLERFNRLSEDPGVWLGENRVTLALFGPKWPISRWFEAAGWRELFSDELAAIYAAPGSTPCRAP